MMTLSPDGTVLISWRDAEGEVIIPDSVIIIEHSAFTGSPLTEIRGNNVTVIRAEAFAGCKNLSRINFPSVVWIGNCGFLQCESLEIVDCSSLQVAGVGAFEGCVSLRYVRFLNLVYMSIDTFIVCPALQAIYLPQTFVGFLDDQLPCYDSEEWTIDISNGEDEDEFPRLEALNMPVMGSPAAGVDPVLVNDCAIASFGGCPELAQIWVDNLEEIERIKELLHPELRPIVTANLSALHFIDSAAVYHATRWQPFSVVVDRSITGMPWSYYARSKVVDSLSRVRCATPLFEDPEPQKRAYLRVQKNMGRVVRRAMRLPIPHRIGVFSPAPPPAGLVAAGGAGGPVSEFPGAAAAADFATAAEGAVVAPSVFSMPWPSRLSSEFFLDGSIAVGGAGGPAPDEAWPPVADASGVAEEPSNRKYKTGSG